MSFYDDASLVFLPSGGAGKDGKAYSIKPVPEYGNELVTNGGFDTDSDWVKGTGWTISGGTANCDGSSNILRQSNAVPLNTKFYVFIEVSNYVSGTLQVKFAPIGYPLNVTKNGIYTISTNGDNSTNGDLQIISTSFIGSIDNVSVKEITTESADFTFSRGGNLTATRVDSNGLIEKGRENLLENSVWDGVTTDTKPTGWTFQFVSGTGTFDVTATEGQIRFQTLDASSRAFIYSPTITTNGIVVASVYVDEVTTAMPLSDLLTRSANATDLFAYEDGVQINYYSDNVQAGKRYSVVFNKTASTNFRFGVGVSSGTLGDVVLSRPQIEVGLVATEWITSPVGSTGLAGILEHSPRFDYSGGASCASLLLEPSRTNLVEYSEYFENTSWWFSTSADVELSDNTSPEGVKNAFKVTYGAGGNRLGGANFGLPNTPHTNSIYMRKVSGSGVVNFANQLGDTNNITLTTDWERYDVTATLVDGTARFYIYLKTFGDVIEVYGAQQEEGSYPTSYIPNHSGGSVTREADECTKTSISGLIGQTEGTIYCEFEYNGAADSGVFNRIIGLGTGVTQNRILLAKNDTTAELVAFAVTGGTTQVFQAIAGTSIIGHHKVAISYKANEYKVYLDGQLKFTDSSASVPATTDVYIGTAEDGTTNNELGGIVKESIIFKEVLSVDNCKALTTL